jgi:hypothetical protein
MASSFLLDDLMNSTNRARLLVSAAGDDFASRFNSDMNKVTCNGSYYNMGCMAYSMLTGSKTLGLRPTRT